MKKIGIFYGSTTGNTEEVARRIAADLGVVVSDVFDVAKTAPSAVAPFDVLLFGASTWGDGDLQEDMHDFLDGVASMNLSGKKGALFGCGDESMADTFCDAVGEMYRMLEPTGIQMIGDFNADGYDFHHSTADTNGHTLGLLIDNVNHSELTEAKIKAWTDELKNQI